MKIIIFVLLFSAWRIFPDGKWCEIVYERQFLPEKDTVSVRHYHKSDNKWYVITIDNRELWCDQITELKNR